MTEIQMKDLVRDIMCISEQCLDLSARFMEVGRNRWIEIAIDEGWTHNLREKARSTAFEMWRKRSLDLKKVAPIVGLLELDEVIKINPGDHEYYRQHGRDVNRVDLYFICKARNARNGKEYPILDNPPPSATMNTDDLVSSFKRSMLDLDEKAKVFGRRPRGA
jgi:hypothetical protein